MKTRQMNILYKLALGTILLIVSACSGDGNQQSSGATIAQQTEPVYGGTLTIGIPHDVDSVNPLFANSTAATEVAHLIFHGLADMNKELELSGELAQSWERSEDGLSLLYRLRPGVNWSDGVPVTAADVKFTHELLADPEVASPRGWVTESIDSVVIVDSMTVKFCFNKDYPYQALDTAGEILPKHLLENVDRKTLSSNEFNEHPVSSGPFILRKWKKQQYLELVANDSYYGGRPYLDRVIFKVIPDQVSRMMQLKTGEIDMMIDVAPGEVAGMKQAYPHLSPHAVSGRLYYFLAYNLALDRFASAKTRMALTMAVNRQSMIDGLLYGYGEHSVGHIPPSVDWAYNDALKPVSFDPQAARELLAEEGWADNDNNGWLDRDGEEFHFVIKTDASNQLKMDAATVIQDQLKEIGVRAEIDLAEWSALQNQLNSREYDAYLGGWNTSLYIDPWPVFHSKATAHFNYTDYNNPAVDSFIESGVAETDRAKAGQIWRLFQKQIYEDQAYTFLFWVERVVAVNERFADVSPIPLSDFYNIERWYDKRAQRDIAMDAGK